MIRGCRCCAATGPDGRHRLWARASLNLGALELRTGNFNSAARALDEALRLSADVQQTELQLISTFNLGHLAREMGDLRRASDTFELTVELADRIGQSEVEAGALACMALCQLALGDVAAARRLSERLVPLVATQSDWFQGREVVEAVAIHLALIDGKDEACELFERALAMAEARDAYGASWLIAQFGVALRERVPHTIDAAIRRFAHRPEVLENPLIREQFGVLMLDSAKAR